MQTSVSSVGISELGNGFSVALEHSFQAYTGKPIKRIFHKEFINYLISHISVSNNGELSALSCIPMTGDRSTQKVFIWDNKSGECLTKLEFKDDVTEIVLRPPYLLVVLTRSVCLFDMKNNVTHLEIITCENPSGAADISLASGTELMCVCGLNEGEVKVMSISNESDPLTIKAHQHQVSAVRFSADASIIVTSGQTGTVIRMFDAVTGTLLSIFRRGNLPQRIVSMAISRDNAYVVVVSASGTIHLFDSKQRNKSIADAPRGIAKYKYEKCECATSAFNEENQLLVLFSTGHLITLKCSESSIDQVEKCFILAH